MTVYDLVFEGGGAKGIAFVGAMEAFSAHGLSYGRLVGTSAGAITATFLAAGYSVEEMRAALEETTAEGKPIFATFLEQPKALSEDELQDGALHRLLEGVDLTFVPDALERSLEGKLLQLLGTSPRTRNLVSFIECGGWYAADAFLAWLRAHLDKGAFQGKPRRFSALTLAEYYEATRRDLSLIAADTSASRMLVLNHHTAPQCPLVWAVRMSMGVPLLWREVIWQEEWGRYRGRDLAGHSVVDGGLLSNFPIELLISDEPQITAAMGTRERHPIIGFLIDESLPVPQVAGGPIPGVEFSIAPLELATVRRLYKLANTATQAHDKAVIDAFEHLVVRLPARGYGTTEFDMSPARRDALAAAGHTVTAAYLDARLAPVAAAPGPGEPSLIDVANRRALRMLDD